MTCSQCGNSGPDGDAYCANCGASLAAQASTGTQTAGLAPDVATAATAPPPAAAPVNQYGAAYQDHGRATAAGATYTDQRASQIGQGQPAPPYGPPAGQAVPVPQAAVTPGSWGPPPGAGAPQPATACPNCGQPWTGSQSCTFCGQLWGLPNGIVLSSVGRRFGGYLLDLLLMFCTLVIGWVIWTLIVWAQGQTPAKQLLGMRVVRLDQRVHAGWGKMFLRDFVGKGIVWLIGYVILFVGGIVADCWLLWDKDRQELWDKVAGTVVVDDPDRRLAPSAQTT